MAVNLLGVIKEKRQREERGKKVIIKSFELLFVK